MLKLGACSPSLKVTSKIAIRSIVGLPGFPVKISADNSSRFRRTGSDRWISNNEFRRHPDVGFFAGIDPACIEVRHRLALVKQPRDFQISLRDFEYESQMQVDHRLQPLDGVPHRLQRLHDIGLGEIQPVIENSVEKTLFARNMVV